MTLIRTCTRAWRNKLSTQLRCWRLMRCGFENRALRAWSSSCYSDLLFSPLPTHSSNLSHPAPFVIPPEVEGSAVRPARPGLTILFA